MNFKTLPAVVPILYPVFCILFPVSCFLSSCDKVEFPYDPSIQIVSTTDTIQKVQKVLLEQYTGHKCGNCPVAAETAIGLQTAREGRLIIVELHYGLLATPVASPYNYDFRTSPGGNEYGAFFQTENHPVGLINRIDFPTNTHKKPPGEWSAHIDSLLATEPPAMIKLTNSFNSSSNELSTEVEIEVLDTLSGMYKLVLWLTEDSIQKPQLDDSKPPGQEDVLDYWHRHSFRASINGIWGDSLTSYSLPGEKILKNYSYLVPDNFKGLATRFNQCSVIAVIYDAATSTPSYKIIQVEEKKIM